MEIEARTAEWLIGGLFIGFYAYRRFSTPSTNRSSTTFSRYHFYFAGYLLTLWALYWVVGSMVETSPDLLERLTPLTGVQLDGYSQMTGPIIAALILTTLLPNVPILASFDKNLLQFFWDLGRIPGHILKQRDWFKRAAYHIHPALVNEISHYAHLQGIEEKDLLFEQTQNINYYWTRLCALFQRVDQWQSAENQRYARFYREQKDEFEALKNEFTIHSAQIASFQKYQPSKDSRPERELYDQLQLKLEIENNQLLTRLCEFIARGIFYSELTTSGRQQMISKMGFDEYSVVDENLTPSQVVTLIGSIAVVMIAIALGREFIRFQSLANVPFDRLLFISSIMIFSYGAAAYAAIYPKTAWHCADFQSTPGRPIFGYFLSGLLAVALTVFTMICVRYTFASAFCHPGGSYECNTSGYFDKMLSDLSWSYPYVIQSFCIAFITAWVADNYPFQGNKSPYTIHLKDALHVALVALFASVVTFYVLESTKDPAFRGRNNFYLFVLEGALVGAVIGYLVPSWYRQNRLRSPTHNINRIIQRNSTQIELEAGRLRPDEFQQALIAAAAHISGADGVIDQTERDYFRQFLYKIESLEIGEINIDTVMSQFRKRITEQGKDPEAKLDEQLFRPLIPHPTLTELVVQLAMGLAHADHVFEKSEEAAINQLLAAFNQPPRTEEYRLQGPNVNRHAVATS